MSEVMVMRSNVDLATYTYTSAPRTISRSRNSSLKSNGNPMYDRRVVRGSNFGRRSDDEYDENEGQQYLTRRQEFRQKMEARARMRRENHATSTRYSRRTYGSQHRVHAHIQTEHPYEPLPGSDEKERILVAHLAKRTLKQALKEVAHEEDGEKERINRLIEETAASFIKTQLKENVRTLKAGRQVLHRKKLLPNPS